MKKYTAILLLSAMLLTLLPGCRSQIDYPAEVFYDADVLEAYLLEEMPVPKLENSRLNGDRLCLNLTDEEYLTYVQTLVTWLQGRPEVNYLSYVYSDTLLFGVFPEETCVPLPPDYDFTADSHRFVFSYSENLYENTLSLPIHISITRGQSQLKRSDFTYNTELRLQTDKLASVRLDPCAAGHRYDEGEVYPVPGLSHSITVSHCVHCGSQTQSDYIGSGNIQRYAVTVSQGKEYIFGNNYNYFPWGITEMYAGQILEIISLIPADGTLQVTVNGDEIPVLRTSEDKVTFGFIMPESDVDIRITLIPFAE